MSDEKKNDAKPEGEVNRLLSNTTYLTSGLFLAGVFLFFIGVAFGGKNIDNPSSFTSFCALIACACITTGGVVIVIRKEAPRPGMRNIKGIGAIITGMLSILTFGCLGLILFRELILRLFSR